MKTIDKKTGLSVQVGDLIRRKDYRGRWKTYRIDEIRPHDVLATELGESSAFNFTTVLTLASLGLACSLF